MPHRPALTAIAALKRATHRHAQDRPGRGLRRMRRGRAVAMGVAVMVSVVVGMNVIHGQMLYYNITEVTRWTRSQIGVLAALIARALRAVSPSREGAGDPKKGAGDPKRAQGRPGARCTRGLACKKQKEDAHEHTGSAEAVRPSLRNGFNGLLRALPGDRLSCHRRRAGMDPLRLDASIGAPGPHDFAVRNQSRSSVVAIASTASHRAFVTIASRPSYRVGWRIEDLIWARTKAEYFCLGDWTKRWCNRPGGQRRDW